MKRVILGLPIFTILIFTLTHCEFFESEPDVNKDVPVEITDTTPVEIPDTAFLYALIDQGVDENGDSLISYSEAKATKSFKHNGFCMINCVLNSISNLKGIEAFIYLDTLCLKWDDLDTVDLSNNKSLKYLEIIACGLDFLNISNCKQLTHLDLAPIAAGPYYGFNNLSSLDITNNIELQYLDCSNNSFTNLDFSNHPSLKYLICLGNSLSNLNASNCTELCLLRCADLADYKGCSVTSLNASGCTSLKHMDCFGIQLTNLDISNCPELIVLNCGSDISWYCGYDYCENLLTNLDLSDNVKLKYLRCDNNKLDYLDISNNTCLERINCENNLLETLDLSNNLALTNLDCSNNNLSSLDISKNTEIGNNTDIENTYPLPYLDKLHLNSCHTYLQFYFKEFFHIPHLRIDGMSALTEVCVWEMPFPPAGVDVDITGSPNVSFTTYCSK